MTDLTDLRRRVLACNWARSGWLPELEVIRWQPLDGWREQHEAAVAALAKAKGEAIGPAIRDLSEVVERCVFDLRQRSGMTYSTASHDGIVNEFEQTYSGERAKVAADPRLRDAPTGRPSIDEWAAKDPAPPPGLVEAAIRREGLVEDWETWRGFANVTLNGPTRLANARIEPLAVNEARAAREELDRVKQSAGAAA